MRRFLIILTGCLVGLTLFSSLAYSIARGYQTDDNELKAGMAAALSDNESGDKVERATQDNSDKLIGIVTTLDKSLVVVGSSQSNVLVESDGQAEAYVSNINGEVKQGDTLTISPLKGILMKSSGGTSSIGVATEDAKDGSRYTYQNDGQEKETTISLIDINLNKKITPNGITTDDSFLSGFGYNVVGKNVSEIRVIFALIVFLLILIAEAGVIYGAVSSSITSLGRNPMAKSIITGQLFRVSGIALGLLLLGLTAVYIILWV